MSGAATRYAELKLSATTAPSMAVSFSGRERISRPFEFEITCMIDDASVTAKDLLLQPVMLKLDPAGENTRVFQGIARSVVAVPAPTGGVIKQFTLSVVPKLWFAGQTIDCRIFQKKTVGDILKTVFAENGQTLRFKATDTQPADYTTQYNETDLAFVSRLMEEAGFFYYFDYSESDHVCVVTDKNADFLDSAGRPITLDLVHNNGITSWRSVAQSVWGKVTMWDYNPLTPSTDLSDNTPTVLTARDAAKRDVNIWPTRGLTKADSTKRSKVLMEGAEALASAVEVTSVDRMMCAGRVFKVGTADKNNQSLLEAGDKYLAVQVDHVFNEPTHYENAALMVLSTAPWRERQETPKPRLPGVYTGIVLGATAEEIECDAQGRIKVRVMWDRMKTTVPSPEMWVRVVQPWAGKGWGWQHLPRVGTEVAIVFMNGDPDLPVVMGGLYNADQTMPFPLPGEKNKSGLKTRSTKQGGTANYSELSFDDTKGSEVVLLHAEKDHKVEVENDHTVTVQGKRVLTVDKTEDITIKQKQTVAVQDARETTITKDEKLTVSQGNRETTISQGNEKLTVSMGNRTTEISMGNDELTVKMGNLKISTNLGSVTIEAMQGIELKVGGSSIKIDMSGVTIQGTMVKAEGQAMLQLKGAMTQVNGDGMLMAKGGITMIN